MDAWIEGIRIATGAAALALIAVLIARHLFPRNPP
jgi:hypothetical protein